ncbi:MAG TPA: transposase [Dehalococcoidia bacterium]
MKSNPTIHHLRSIRLPRYDYRLFGAYLVTICTYRRECTLNDDRIRQAVQLSWRSANGGRKSDPYDFIVMPNHVHGIVWVSEKRGVVTARDVVRAQRGGPSDAELDRRSIRAGPPLVRKGVAPLRSGSLGEIVRMFKSLSTKRINGLRGAPGLPVWKRNYYERVVRDDDELRRVRQYILDNPAKWAEDPNNPAIIKAKT